MGLDSSFANGRGQPPSRAQAQDEQDAINREMWYRRCLSNNLPELQLPSNSCPADIEQLGSYNRGGYEADAMWKQHEASQSGYAQFPAPFKKPSPFERELELGLLQALLRMSMSRSQRKRLTWALLAVALASLVFLNFMTCNFFICVSVRVTPTGSYIDLKDLFSESYLLHPKQGGSQAHSTSASPLLIPRTIHQTYGSKKFPERMQKLQHSWTALNGNDWGMEFYDDAKCLSFVRTEYPEYFDAYVALPENIERSDFFRYLVVLRYGGVYADMDVECRQSLDSLIHPTDTMVVGWEVEVPDDATATLYHYARKRQLLQWFFAAAPGHPALRAVCDKINSHALRTFSNNTNQDTLERTGPGVWTDVILKYALEHPISVAGNPWKVRILPRIAFGLPTDGTPDMNVMSKEVVVLHHFLGSWKKKDGWRRQRSLYQILVDFLQRSSRSAPMETDEPIRDPLRAPHFPVSMNWNPHFTMMVNLVGHGDTQWNEDVAFSISNWGSWQASLSPGRGPSVAEALIGSLGNKEHGTTLVDVGAGLGFFSLAAAARGHRALAFETSGPSLASLKSSIRYNGFEAQVKLHAVPLGAAPGQTCIQRCTSESGADAADVEIRRGYGPWGVHSANGTACGAVSVRMQLGTQLPNDDSVGAMRLSANGWESAILEGAESWMTAHPPGVVLIEFSPRLMRRAGDATPWKLLSKMLSLGYSNMAHAGPVCDGRWESLTQGKTAGSMQQPTWCKLRPEHFHLLTNHTHHRQPENLLFIHHRHSSQQPVSGSDGDEQTSSMLGNALAKQ